MIGQTEESKRNLEHVIERLWRRFGRQPTEVEVYTYILGSDFDRQALWDRGGLSL